MRCVCSGQGEGYEAYALSRAYGLAPAQDGQEQGLSASDAVTLERNYCDPYELAFLGRLDGGSATL